MFKPDGECEKHIYDTLRKLKKVIDKSRERDIFYVTKYKHSAYGNLCLFDMSVYIERAMKILMEYEHRREGVFKFYETEKEESEI